jgi:biopolymer transport protein ExbB/TolQ
MTLSFIMGLMDTVVSWLLQPVVAGLLFLLGLAIWELGLAVGERHSGIRRLETDGAQERLIHLARRRIDRADLLARIGPMLGLMGTLIPLGPGLAAMGRGELDVLAEAVTVAFNTTVLGLLIGILGFLLSRLRRRWYDGAMERLEQAEAQA